MDIKKNLVAILLIGLVILLTPTYLRWISPPPPESPLHEQPDSYQKQGSSLPDIEKPATQQKTVPGDITKKPVSQGVTATFSADSSIEEKTLTIETDLYIATLSNRAGGSFVDFKLKDFTGGFDDNEIYSEDGLVSLILPSDTFCTPCVSLFDRDLQTYYYFNQPFEITTTNVGSNIILMPDESFTVHFSLDLEDGRSLQKSVTFEGGTYNTFHEIRLQGFEDAYRQYLEILWDNGLKPTEFWENEDILYSGAVINQSGETDKIVLKGKDPVEREVFDGNTDWVAVKNKYFIAAILPDTPGIYGALSARNTNFNHRDVTPVYFAAIGYDLSQRNLNTKIFIGPQDLKILESEGKSLEDAMNWGYAFIKPISKYVVMNLLTFLHNPFGDFYINYGLVLILFAFIIRIITGPLTKKSAESAQKMQQLQPKVKAINEKYKDDPQKKGAEMMKVYSEHGISPLGGCLPMIIQMPLLFALFVVFRNTIEFRGAEFIFWIKDLSLPDVIFTLPFSIPIYGSGVAILPLFMGITMFLQQRQSMATMDKNQRPMMYIMTGFFFLLFNQFPSGLNLYYATYNLLNILQQRKIKKNLKASTK